jgi:hypothetical protein
LRSQGGEVLIIADKELTKEDVLTVADDRSTILKCTCSFYYCVNKKEIFVKVKHFSNYGFIRGNSIVIDKNL